MFSRIQTERMHRMEFVACRANKADYMTRCIWITLQVHRVMQEFVQGGLQSQSSLWLNPRMLPILGSVGIQLGICM